MSKSLFDSPVWYVDNPDGADPQAYAEVSNTLLYKGRPRMVLKDGTSERKGVYRPRRRPQGDMPVS